eukprot:c4729_g1_i2.p1 GENE.c4729_g1_i2~~c4729_g1_i2.p1  ORF type:complete len:179 (+),score=15.04 c4729_g1_i2:3-539(+)
MQNIPESSTRSAFCMRRSQSCLNLQSADSNPSFTTSNPSSHLPKKVLRRPQVRRNHAVVPSGDTLFKAPPPPSLCAFDEPELIDEFEFVLHPGNEGVRKRALTSRSRSDTHILLHEDEPRVKREMRSRNPNSGLPVLEHSSLLHQELHFFAFQMFIAALFVVMAPDTALRQATMCLDD